MKEFNAHSDSFPATVAQFPTLNFDILQPGDVCLMNTNGPAVGKLMGFTSPAGQLGLTHASMVYDAPYKGNGGRALMWEMFEKGADIRPMQDHPREEQDVPDEYLYRPENGCEEHKMMVIRYVGRDSQELKTRLQEVFTQALLRGRITFYTLVT